MNASDAAAYEEALQRSSGGLRDVILRFVDELRLVGIPVSIAEVLDALTTLEHVPLTEREVFKAGLAATMVKNPTHVEAFDTAFEVFFSLRPSESIPGSEGAADDALRDDPDLSSLFEQGQQAGGGGGDADTESLLDALFQALLEGDDAQMRGLARMAVSAFAGMEPGRPVGGTYYLYRTLRAIESEKLLERLLDAERLGHDESAELPAGDLDDRLLREEYEARLRRLTDALKAEIRRRLVDDRGSEAVAKTLRKPLLEEVDFMHATSVEMRDLRRVIAPLARRLAAKLSMQRRHRTKGRLDVRKTMRESLSTGGVPLDPKFKHPRPHKPELVVLCDISGSVASFARFTLQFMYAISLQFSKVRSFVFIDEIDEVTPFFETDDLGNALTRINTEASVVWIDGHSDYGNAFLRFGERHLDAITSKSSVIITGDARNNYHASQVEVLAEMSDRARSMHWLNPEPLAYWDTGDSIVSQYGTVCDGVHQVRNLKQLEEFVESLVG